MEFRVSARKWRPQTFDEVVGQDHVSRTLKNAVLAGHVGSGYVFSGMRGVGKTTMARILAKALNCEKGPTPEPCGTCDSCREIAEGTSMDVIEIDAASNRGIDEIRELRENIKYSPIGGRRKIYIIDEVHMLTEPAFNALLKTLEEPPPHAVFVLATTEIRKIPATILSRCQHFQFHRIPFAQIVERLALVAEKEGLSLSSGSRAQIARASEGSLRDALSLLDQVSTFADREVRDEDVAIILGKAGFDPLMTLAGFLIERNANAALDLAAGLESMGHDIPQICADCVELFRDLAIAKTASNPSDLIAMPSEELERLKTLSARCSHEELLWLFSVFSQALAEMRGPVRPGIVFEMTIVRACRISPVVPVEEMIERLESIEKRLGQSLPAESNSGEDGAERPLPSRPPRAEDPKIRSGSEREDASGDVLNTGALWSAVVSKVREKKPNLGSYLEQGNPVRMTDREVVVGFQEGGAFLIGLLEKEDSRFLIREILQEVFGKPLVLKLEAVSGKGGAAAAPAKEREQKELDQRKRMIEDVLANPVVQEVLNIFGGEVVQVKKQEP